MTISAPELYALSQDALTEGRESCHWCGSACKQLWVHDDPMVGPLLRNPIARRPANHWICIGCWLFRRERITIHYLNGTLKDSQAPTKHSWWITEKGAWAIRPEDYAKLLDLILEPPSAFVLTLLSDPTVRNIIHLAVANDFPGIVSNTPIHFTQDNKPFQYTVYELKEAFKYGPKGKEPGVQILHKLLSPYASMEVDKPKKGRPSGEGIRKTVLASGSVAVV